MRRAWYLASMLRTDRMPPHRYIAEQERLLRALIRHSASQVPFYTQLYRDIDVTSICTIADLARLPVVGKSELRAAGASWRALNAPARLVRVNTSGSSGSPFRFEIDTRYDEWRKAQYLRPYLSNGRGLRERVLRFRTRARLGAERPWFRRAGVLPEWSLDVGSTAEEVRQQWHTLRPTILQGYPSGLALLAQACLEQRRPLLPSPRLIFTDSELLSPETRTLIEHGLGAPVIDVFGTFETDNIAYQCGRRDGYHLTPDSVIVEVLRDGIPVAPGEAGELVVTVLRNWTMPFIRYNLRDIVTLSPEPCGCGRSTPVLKVVAGRADDFIAFPDGRRCSPLNVISIFSPLSQLLRQYQVRQVAIDGFEIQLVPTARFTDADREQLRSRLAEFLGPARLEFHETERIPREPSGKLRAIISQIPAGKHAQ